MYVTCCQVMRCTNIAAVKVAEVTELIQRAVDDDAAARVSGSVGMVTSTTDSAAAAAPAASVELSHTETVDMKAAMETAATVTSVIVSDDDSSSASSVVHSDSVPTAAVVDTG